MDLESMRLLVAINEHGSVSAAARALGISQPAATARLRAVEARYRIALVRRSSRGSQLTEDGQAVCAWAQRVLREFGVLEAGITALSAQKRGDLQVAASLTIAEYLMPEWLARMHAAHPEVSVSLSVVNSAEVLNLLRAEKVSIGFVEVPGKAPSTSDLTVSRDQLVVIVSPGHPWAKRHRPLSAEELAEAEWVLREVGSGTRETFRRVLPAEPRVALVANSTSTVIASVARGFGPSVVSELAVRDHLRMGQVVAVPAAIDLSRPLRAVWPEKTRLRSPALDLVNIARSTPPPAQLSASASRISASRSGTAR